MAAAQQQRKLTTILAADMAGFSRLVGADEEGTLARLRALRRDTIEPLVAGRSGRLIKTTGDGLLIEFASVVDAVQAALEIQRAVAERNAGIAADRRIEFRIGINLGDVMVEDDGDLLGDGVNIAARLEGIAAPGGTCISASVFEQVHNKVAAKFADLGPVQLKNIARPVHAYAVSEGDAAQPKPAAAPAAAPPAAGPRLSIVVLPFANLGGDSEQDYFVDGITENLTTDLSRLPGAFVIARNTAFTLKGKPVNARAIGQELGVRYVLEGSVQSGSSRIRVNAQLIDALTGAHLWAERFDKPREDLFDMQDEITARLARAIGIELVAAEGRRAERERGDNLDAVDLAMRGRAIMNRPPSLQNMREARVLFEAALQLNAQDVEALVGLAQCHIYEVRAFASTDRQGQIAIGESAIGKALALAPDNAFAHLVKAELLHVKGLPEQSLEECERALALDPNLAWAHANAGFMELMAGHGEKTEERVRKAMRLSPRDPALGFWLTMMGAADLYLGRIDRAIQNLRTAIGANAAHPLPHFFLAAALALGGQIEEAGRARADGLRLDPNFTVARFRDELRSSNKLFLTQRERMYEGLRLAGVPER